MKVVAFNGSPRREGNTAILINTMFEIFQNEGIETEFIQLGNKPVHGCTACGKCREIQNGKCHIKNGHLNFCIEKTAKMKDLSSKLNGWYIHERGYISP